MSAPLLDEPRDDEALPPDASRKARRLMAVLLRPRARRVVLLGLLLVAEVLATIAGPFFVARALDLGLPAARAGDYGSLIAALAGFTLAGLIAGLLSWFEVRLNGTLSQDILLDLRTRVFDHVQRLSLSYHERSTSGRLVSRQTSDMNAVQEFTSYSLNDAMRSLLTMSGIAVILLFMNVPMALVAFAGFVPLYFITRAAHRTQRDSYRKTRTAIARVIVHFVETMGGIRAVQAFRRQPAGNRVLAAEDIAYRDANTAALQGVAWFAGGTRLVGNITQAALLAIGGALVINGYAEVGVLAAFLLYLRRFYGPLDELVQAFNMYQSASAALEKIAVVLAEEPDVPEPVTPSRLPAVAGTGAEAAFEGVGFSYNDGTEVLPRFDLRIAPGQIVALLGATGAGKTTLAKLITRFYDPGAGRITLDGVDLREVSDADLRAAVVMVTQESFLFSGSVADNIRIGRPGASDEEVVDAARAVGLDAFIRGLPEGYDTDVQRRGGRLSSGQRQLVAFARVFLADPRVMVLDEATASLDIPSERLVQDALATVLEGRTAIIIAHRLSTAEIADRVLVMDRGRIVEDGAPRELLAEGGRFTRLHEAWRHSLS